MDVFGHARFVTADVEVRAVVEPLPDFCTVFLEAVLDVDLLFLVAGPSGGELVEVAAVHPAFDLLLVVVFRVLRLVTKEEPVSTLGFVVNTLFHEGAEGSDTCTWSDHDDVNAVVFREDELLVGDMKTLIGAPLVSISSAM